MRYKIKVNSEYLRLSLGLRYVEDLGALSSLHIS